MVSAPQLQKQTKTPKTPKTPTFCRIFLGNKINNKKENGGAEGWLKEQDGIWYVLSPGKKGASEKEVKDFEVEMAERWRAHCQEMGQRMDEARTGITDYEGTIWML